MSNLPYWQDDAPFVGRTSIRATPMNAKLGGISANLQQITAKINGFVIKLPSTFVGNTEIPNKSYTDTLLYINTDGNVDLIPRGNLIADASIEVEQVTRTERTFAVDGNNHNQFIHCAYDMQPGATGDDAKVLVTIGRAIRDFEGNPVVVPGSLIFLSSDTDAELWVEGDANEGVTIRSPGTLKAYERNSSIALMAVNETTWLMLGDIYPNEVSV